MHRRSMLIAPAILLNSRLSFAQSSQPLIIMVPYPAGGTSDVFARTIAPALGRALGRTTIVENLSGANGSIAAAKVLSQGIRGDMIFFASPGELIMAPQILRAVKYKANEFKALGIVSRPALALYVRETMKFSNVDEFVAWGRTQKAESISYGSSGIGSVYHLAGAAFAEGAGLRMNHSPYKGAQPMLQDLMGGHIDMAMFAADGQMAKFVASGKLRPLAVTGNSRSPAFPDVPTFAESKMLKSFSTVDVWGGVFAPAATPNATLVTLHRAVQAAIADPVTHQQLEATASIPLMPPMSLAALTEFYQGEIARFSEAAQRANLEQT